MSKKPHRTKALAALLLCVGLVVSGQVLADSKLVCNASFSDGKKNIGGASSAHLQAADDPEPIWYFDSGSNYGFRPFTDSFLKSASSKQRLSDDALLVTIKGDYMLLGKPGSQRRYKKTSKNGFLCYGSSTGRCFTITSNGWEPGFGEIEHIGKCHALIYGDMDKLEESNIASYFSQLAESKRKLAEEKAKKAQAEKVAKAQLRKETASRERKGPTWVYNRIFPEVFYQRDTEQQQTKVYFDFAYERFLQSAKALNIAKKDVTRAMLEGRLDPHPDDLVLIYAGFVERYAKKPPLEWIKKNYPDRHREIMSLLSKGHRYEDVELPFSFFYNYRDEVWNTHFGALSDVGRATSVYQGRLTELDGAKISRNVNREMEISAVTYFLWNKDDYAKLRTLYRGLAEGKSDYNSIAWNRRNAQGHSNVSLMRLFGHLLPDLFLTNSNETLKRNGFHQIVSAYVDASHEVCGAKTINKAVRHVEKVKVYAGTNYTDTDYYELRDRVTFVDEALLPLYIRAKESPGSAAFRMLVEAKNHKDLIKRALTPAESRQTLRGHISDWGCRSNEVKELQDDLVRYTTM